MIAVQRVGEHEAAELVPALADLLIDAVEGGASVNFLSPLERTEAEAFWQRVALSVERRDRVLLAAFGASSTSSLPDRVRPWPNQRRRECGVKRAAKPRRGVAGGWGGALGARIRCMTTGAEVAWPQSSYDGDERSGTRCRSSFFERGTR